MKTLVLPAARGKEILRDPLTLFFGAGLSADTSCSVERDTEKCSRAAFLRLKN